MQLEYWLRFDFTGCVRKLLPPTQQVGAEGAPRPGRSYREPTTCTTRRRRRRRQTAPRRIPRLPAVPAVQALCMVASYPFYPDQKHLVAAIKDKAGQLWEQLRRA